MIATLKRWARGLKRDLWTLYLAGADPRVPWAAKWLAVAVAAYALSPLDLIPDFIPVLGYLDDLILLPAGIWLALRLIPAPVLADLRRQAQERLDSRPPRSRAAGAVVVGLWLAGAAALGWWAWRRWGGPTP